MVKVWWAGSDGRADGMAVGYSTHTSRIKFCASLMHNAVAFAPVQFFVCSRATHGTLHLQMHLVPVLHLLYTHACTFSHIFLLC